MQFQHTSIHETFGHHLVTAILGPIPYQSGFTSVQESVHDFVVAVNSAEQTKLRDKTAANTKKTKKKRQLYALR